MSEPRSPFEPPVAGTGLVDLAQTAVPFLPPARSATTPIAPTIPVATPANAVAAQVAEFNARQMAESQRVKVAEPSYGGLPHGDNEASKAAIEAGRERMLAARRKNDRFARGILFVLLSIVAAGGAGMYFLFQASQETDDAPTQTVAPTPASTTPPSSASATTVPAQDASAVTTTAVPGAATPLGEQEQVIELQDQVNSGATMGAGGLGDAVDQAQQVVDGINGVATTAPAQP